MYGMRAACPTVGHGRTGAQRLPVTEANRVSGRKLRREKTSWAVLNVAIYENQRSGAEM